MKNFLKNTWARFKRWIQGALVATGIVAVAMAASVGGTPSTFEDIQNAQQAYFDKHGEYLQVIPDNRLPHYKAGTVLDELGIELPSNHRIDVYQQPESKGGDWGFQVKWEDDKGKYSEGVGDEAANRDYTILKEDDVATTTSLLPSWEMPDLRSFSNLFSFVETALAAQAHSQTHTTDLEDTSSQFWSIADNADFSITGDWSWCGWYQMEDTVSPVSYFSKSSSTLGIRSWNIRQSSGSNVRVTFYSDGSTTTNSDFAHSPSTGTWVHLCGILDVSVPEVNLVIDGTAQGAKASASSIHDGDQDVRIGTRETNDQFFDGLIDDVYVWSREITTAEAADAFNNPCTFDPGASNVAFWEFNDNGDDSSGNGNDLTNNNSATFQTTDLPFECAAAAGNTALPLLLSDPF